MDCHGCSGKIIEVKKDYHFESKALGIVQVPNITFHECTSCGKRVINFQEAKKVTDFVHKKELQALCRLPIGEFLSQNQAAEILEMSKQAFSKNSRIKRGFIYFVQIDGKKFYYSRSVEQFKKNRDGRIRLENALPDSFTVFANARPEWFPPSLSSPFLPDLETIDSPKEKSGQWLNS